MKQLEFPYLNHHQWQIFADNDLSTPLSADETLAYQDSFIRWLPTLHHQATNIATGIVHFYPIQVPTVLLGAKDTRLPQLQTGLDWLTSQGYDYALRSHGGLGVVCDSGVLNIGLASDLNQFPLSIDMAYEQMVTLIHLSLIPYDVTVEAYEIPDSYCPGTYDLVVNGQKIGGIAQRRFKNGITTAAYLSVNGNQNKRAELMANFYRHAHADNSYPVVHAASMTTIETVIGKTLELHDYQHQLIKLITNSAINVQHGNYQLEGLQSIFAKMLPIAKQRTQSLTQF